MQQLNGMSSPKDNTHIVVGVCGATKKFETDSDLQEDLGLPESALLWEQVMQNALTLPLQY
jgi:hypothetical protein